MKADPTSKIILITYVIASSLIGSTIGQDDYNEDTQGTYDYNEDTKDAYDYNEDMQDKYGPDSYEDTKDTYEYVGEGGQTRRMGARRGSGDDGQSVKAGALELEEKYESTQEGKPRHALHLADKVVGDLFRKRGGQITTMEIMQALDDLRGVHKLQALQIFERMDVNLDGQIDEEEFTSMYGTIAADPANFFSAMFTIQDFNGDGSLSIWELLRQEASKLGYDYDLSELFKLAQQQFIEMDADSSDDITRDEYIAYLVYLITKSIGKIKAETEELNKSGK